MTRRSVPSHAHGPCHLMRTEELLNMTYSHNMLERNTTQTRRWRKKGDGGGLQKTGAECNTRAALLEIGLEIEREFKP